MNKVFNYWKRFKIRLSTALKKGLFLYFGKKSFIGLHTITKGEQYISIGNNCYIGNYCLITAWDKYINQKFVPQITIGNDCHLGSFNHITAINKIFIGNNVLTGQEVLITDNSHGYFTKEDLEIPPINRHLHTKGPVIIEDNVWIGEKATICPNVHIGYGAVIAANSVVTHNVPAYSMAAGAPAKIIKQINTK